MQIIMITFVLYTHSVTQARYNDISIFVANRANNNIILERVNRTGDYKFLLSLLW